MNRTRAKELLPIIQAFADGKDVHIKKRDGKWHEECADDPDFSYGEWRIKPEPELIYVIENKHTKCKTVVSDLDYWPEHNFTKKKYLEVIE